MSLFEFQAHVPRKPRGGHHYPEDDGTTITADSLDSLKDKVALHRARNGRPLGDVEQDILGYYSEIAPFLVKIRPCHKNPVQSMRNRTAEQLLALWHSRPVPKISSADQAKLDVCRKCQACKLDFDDAAGPYWHEADMRGAALSGSINYLSDGVCSHHSLPVSILAGLASPELVAQDSSPPNCWLKPAQEAA